MARKWPQTGQKSAKNREEKVIKKPEKQNKKMKKMKYFCAKKAGNFQNKKRPFLEYIPVYRVERIKWVHTVLYAPI